jgi:hypothetical protein
MVMPMKTHTLDLSDVGKLQTLVGKCTNQLVWDFNAVYIHM